MSAHNKVKQRLLDGKTITPKQCWHWWGCSRLAVIINRLINEGYTIDKDLVGRQRYARYYISVKV